jgi:hypothetical protein
MSSYPPPPPGSYPPPYGRDALRAQRQALKEQARLIKTQAQFQRSQLRLQRRSLRRNSLVGPIILLAVGIFCLLAELGRISWGQSLEWYARWWPAVLILAGLLLLAEWTYDQRRPDGSPQVRVLGGGVVFLLIVLAIAGLSARGLEHALDWHDSTFGPGNTRFDHLFGEQHDADSALSSAIDPGATLVVHNPHGDVTMTGSSSDGQVHVTVHTHSYAWKDSDAQSKARRLQPGFTHQGKDLELDVASVEGGQCDLTIELPRTSAITLEAGRGDVNINEMSAPVSVSANHGDVEIKAVNAPVNLHVNDDDATLTLQSITGAVVIDGRGGDMDISEIQGDLSMQGDFFGSTHVQHVTGAVHFQTSRTLFSTARLGEDFSVSDDDLDASGLIGPVVLKANDKNVTLDRVSGVVDISNRNGSVSLTHAQPMGAISIQNTHGSVDLGVPKNVGFQLNAQTRNGSIENDFGFSEADAGDNHTLTGKVAGGGPPVTIATSDGDITVRRSSVSPVPPAPPQPPSPSTAPEAPKAPKPPTVPAPVSRTF